MKHADKNLTVLFSAEDELHIGREVANCRMALAESYGTRLLRITGPSGEEILSLTLEPFRVQLEAVKQGMIGGNEIIADLIDTEASKQGTYIYKDSRLALARFMVAAIQHEMKQPESRQRS